MTGGGEEAMQKVMEDGRQKNNKDRKYCFLLVSSERLGWVVRPGARLFFLALITTLQPCRLFGWSPMSTRGSSLGFGKRDMGRWQDWLRGETGERWIHREGSEGRFVWMDEKNMYVASIHFCAEDVLEEWSPHISPEIHRHFRGALK